MQRLRNALKYLFSNFILGDFLINKESLYYGGDLGAFTSLESM